MWAKSAEAKDQSDMLKRLAREMNEIASWLERFENSRSAPIAALQLRGGAKYLKSLARSFPETSAPDDVELS